MWSFCYLNRIPIAMKRKIVSNVFQLIATDLWSMYLYTRFYLPFPFIFRECVCARGRARTFLFTVVRAYFNFLVSNFYGTNVYVLLFLLSKLLLSRCGSIVAVVLVARNTTRFVISTLSIICCSTLKVAISHRRLLSARMPENNCIFFF